MSTIARIESVLARTYYNGAALDLSCCAGFVRAETSEGRYLVFQCHMPRGAGLGGLFCDTHAKLKENGGEKQ